MHAKSAEPAFRAFLIDKVALLRQISARFTNDRVVERVAHKKAFQEAIELGLSGENTSFALLACLLNDTSSFRLALNDTFRNLDSDVYVVLLAAFKIPGGKFPKAALGALRGKWTKERDSCLATENVKRLAAEKIKSDRCERQRKQLIAIQHAAQQAAQAAAEEAVNQLLEQTPGIIDG
jgi:hypothetical protein